MASNKRATKKKNEKISFKKVNPENANVFNIENEKKMRELISRILTIYSILHFS
ncbi:MAG: hypothetical protein K5656_06860 [Lachnospiraceae bacterium]|nr:hypothetical protein [Lachnospiraceae bacterium]